MKKKQRILYKKIAIVLFVVLLIILVRAVWGGFDSLTSIQEQREQQVYEFELKDERVAGLEEQIAFLDTQEGLEQEMIATLPIKRPGEQVTILIEQEEREMRFLEREEEKSSWWKFWKR